MKRTLAALTAICAAGLVAAQAQNSPDSSSSKSTTGAGATSSSDQSGQAIQSAHQQSSGSLSATGRSGQQEVRASKLMNAEVKGSSGAVGTINDIIVNPASGKIDFAVISLNSSGSSPSSSASASASPSDNATSPGATTATPASRPYRTPGVSGSTATSGSLVAVPWHLLRPAGSSSTYGSTSATASQSSGAEVSFMFAGDQSKLQGAPTFDQNNWPDFSQPSWRQSVYSYFGTASGSSTGGATSPGGTSSSSSDSSSSTIQPSSQSPNSSSSSPRDSTGSSSKP